MAIEEHNCNCPACELMLAPEAEYCPECGLRFCPRKRNPWTWYCRSWRFWRSTTGRATPQEFYAFFLPNLALLVWWWVEVCRLQQAGSDFLCSLLVIGLSIYHLLAIVPFCTLLTRRLHDRDGSWSDLPEQIRVAVDDHVNSRVWCAFDHLEPMVWLWMAVHVLLREIFCDTIPGPNRYGPSVRYPRYNSHLR